MGTFTVRYDTLLEYEMRVIRAGLVRARLLAEQSKLYDSRSVESRLGRSTELRDCQI